MQGDIEGISTNPKNKISSNSTNLKIEQNDRKKYIISADIKNICRNHAFSNATNIN